MAARDVFTTKDGSQLVTFETQDFGHTRERYPSQNHGWRERTDGTREAVQYIAGSWQTDKEAITARLHARDFDRRYR